MFPPKPDRQTDGNTDRHTNGQTLVFRYQNIDREIKMDKEKKNRHIESKRQIEKKRWVNRERNIEKQEER